MHIHQIIFAVGIGLGLGGMSNPSEAQLLLTEEQREAVYELDPRDLSPIDRERHNSVLRIVQRALGLEDYCAAGPVQPRPECTLSMLVIPGPVAIADGSRICGLYSPEVPGVVLIVVGGQGRCSKEVGDRAFFGTLAHEYAHRLQVATRRHEGDPCAREWMEAEAHAVGDLVQPDVNNATATLLYARRCMDKRRAK